MVSIEKRIDTPIKMEIIAYILVFCNIRLELYNFLYFFYHNYIFFFEIFQLIYFSQKSFNNICQCY